MGFTVTNIRHVSVGVVLRESNIKHLQDSRKQDRERRGRERNNRREGCEEGSGEGDCITCLERESGNFNYEKGGLDFPSQW